MRHLPLRRRSLLLLCALSAGCASAKGGGGFAEEDLAEVADLAAPADEAAPADLRAAPGDDLRTPPAPDLATGTDLRAVTGCQIVPQSGCPTGQKCTTHDVATTICDPGGTALRGQTCTVFADADNCVGGNVCIDEGATLSQCRAYCKTNADCGDARSFCDFNLGGTMAFKVCTQPCNAIYPGVGCAAGLACGVSGQEHTDCQAPGASNEGQPCSTIRDCKGGMACIGPVGASICRRVCRKGDSTGCKVTDSCYGIQSGTFVWPTYGVCCDSFAGC